MGARAATGEVLVLSNDDILIDGGLLDYVADFLLKKSVGVVGLGREGEVDRGKCLLHREYGVRIRGITTSARLMFDPA